jgi:gluconate 2-dehydrogenase subunit 3-like protein
MRIRYWSDHPSQSPTRRDALRIIANVVPAAAVPALSQTTAQHVHPSQVTSAAAYQPKFFTALEMKTIDALSEIIIPADEHSGGARAARVVDYVDITVSANHAIQEHWRRGLAALDETCKRRYLKNFVDSSPSQQAALLEELSAGEDAPASLMEEFFVTAKKATVEGYYTSAIGIHNDLEYQGNTVVANFEGCTHQHDGPGDIP